MSLKFKILLLLIVFNLLNADENLKNSLQNVKKNGLTEKFEEIPFLKQKLRVPASVEKDVQYFYKMIRDVLKSAEKEGKILEKQIKEYLKKKDVLSKTERQRKLRTIRLKHKKFERNLRHSLKPLQARAKQLKLKSQSMLRTFGNHILHKKGRFQLGIIDSVMDFFKIILKYPFELFCNVFICPSHNYSEKPPPNYVFQTTTTEKTTTEKTTTEKTNPKENSSATQNFDNPGQVDFSSTTTDDEMNINYN